MVRLIKLVREGRKMIVVSRRRNFGGGGCGGGGRKGFLNKSGEYRVSV